MLPGDLHTLGSVVLRNTCFKTEANGCKNLACQRGLIYHFQDLIRVSSGGAAAVVSVLIWRAFGFVGSVANFTRGEEVLLRQTLISRCNKHVASVSFMKSHSNYGRRRRALIGVTI